MKKIKVKKIEMKNWITKVNSGMISGIKSGSKGLFKGKGIYQLLNERNQIIK